MKTLILSLVTLATLSANAVMMPGYQPGRVMATACGQNEAQRLSTQGQNYISTVCRVTIQGSRQSTPAYTFTVVNAGNTKTYLYNQVSLQPLHSTPVSRPTTIDSRIMTGVNAILNLQIAGEVVNGQFMAFRFFRAPDITPVLVNVDKYGSVSSLLGNFLGFGDNREYQLQVKKMNTIYYAQ